MLRVVAKQQTTTVQSDFGTEVIKARLSDSTTKSYLETATIKVTMGSVSIPVYDDTVIYVEPFVYMDGGLFDAEGTPVDALFYNTLSWDNTWDAKYA